MIMGLKWVRTYRYPFTRVVIIIAICLLPQAVSFARTFEISPESPLVAGIDTTSQRLVGTALTPEPGTSLAVVEDQNNRQQRIVHEGDRLGRFTIRKILRNSLVVEDNGSEKVVMMGAYLASASAVPPANEAHLTASVVTERTGSREHYYGIDRHRLAAALSDTGRVLESVDISAGHLFNRDTGFRIAGLKPGSIFSEMGLRNGDLILSVSGREISGPEEAPDFLNRVLEGGDLNLTVRRRARTYQIHLQIE